MELTADIIKKYAKYTVPQLRKKAGDKFRAFIRKRDEGQRCISCNTFHVTQASHFYSAGHYPGLEFTEDNCWGSCLRCNMYLSGNLNEYRIRLIRKIGEERVLHLDKLAGYYKKHGYKHDRFRLIEIIQKYK